MKALPVYATDLVRELDRDYPERCIALGQSEIEAHRYAAARALVVGLLRRLETTNSSDPTKPLLGG